MTSLTYQLNSSLNLVEFSEDVLTHFESNKQRGWLSCEAGGQLFAEIDRAKSIMRIIGITGPRPTDRRSVFGYLPDRSAEKREIKEYYLKGLHFIGDWHTHRQKKPTPSTMDQASMLEMVRRSTHDFPGFIMVIVGQADFPGGLHVSFHSDTISNRLALAK